MRRCSVCCRLRLRQLSIPPPTQSLLSPRFLLPSLSPAPRPGERPKVGEFWVTDLEWRQAGTGPSRAASQGEIREAKISCPCSRKLLKTNVRDVGYRRLAAPKTRISIGSHWESRRGIRPQPTRLSSLYENLNLVEDDQFGRYPMLHGNQSVDPFLCIDAPLLRSQPSR